MQQLEKRPLTLGSLFDGIAGFPLAASRAGIVPVWASEIEPAPIAVSRRHFPSMKHLGSVTDINGAEIEPVDIITFGSPCQDLSVAGKRRGLGLARTFRVKTAPEGWEPAERSVTVDTRAIVRYSIEFRKGTRSGLFMEAVRIIREMQEATKDGPEGQKPALAVWENVPGAFSSNAGRDLAAVLQSLVGGEVDVPRGGWANAGVAFGPQGQAAWRVVDAQFWGVPQRRRRIVLVYDPRTERAGEILFEPYGLSGDSSQGSEAGQGVAAGTQDGPGAGGGVHTVCLGSDPLWAHDVAQPITGRNGDPGVVVHSQSEDREAATERKAQTKPIAFSCKDSGQDAGDVSPTIRAMNHNRSHQNGGGQVAVVEPFAFALRGRDEGIRVESHGDGETASAIRSASGGSSRDYVATPVAYAVKTNQTGANGSNVLEGAAFGLNATDKQAISVLVDCRNGTENQIVAPTLQCGPHGYAPNVQGAVRIGYIVRRLTPTECERLQGLPDGWTEWGVDEHGSRVNLSDTARYKALGNGIAQPPFVWLMNRIAQVLRPAHPSEVEVVTYA